MKRNTPPRPRAAASPTAAKRAAASLRKAAPLGRIAPLDPPLKQTAAPRIRGAQPKLPPIPKSAKPTAPIKNLDVRNPKPPRRYQYPES